MLHLETYKERGASHAILETIYRGLYASLKRDPALGKRLVLFLPYAVTYPQGEHVVRLIDPQRIGWELPVIHANSNNEERRARERAERFLATNSEVVRIAIESGRSKSSILYGHVNTINEAKQAGARIDAGFGGQITYRTIKKSRGASAAVSGVEYDIADSFPDLYPALGVLCQVDGKVIGMVSMDFDDQLSEKIDAAFNSFMEPYSGMHLWQELVGESLIEFFKNAQASGTWFEAGREDVGCSHYAFADDTAFQRACGEIKGKLTTTDWEKLKAILDAAEGKEHLKYSHNLLGALQGADQADRVVPALWVALGNGLNGKTVMASGHFLLVKIVDPASNVAAQNINLAAGHLHSQWQWDDCELACPWILLKGESDDDNTSALEQRMARPHQQGHHGFSTALHLLAEALSAAWPKKYAGRFEMRAVPAGGSTANSVILETCFPNTPLAILLGPGKKMVVAVRGEWQTPAFT